MPEALEQKDSLEPQMSQRAAKILVVDDEPDLEMLVSQKFRKQVRDGRYQFLFASNGQEALDKLNIDRDIALVLTDINMPIMDGLTLLKKVKQGGFIAKVVVMSAYGDMGNIRTAMNLGAFDFLTKPVDFQDVEITINKTLDEVKVLDDGRQAQENLKVTEIAKEKAEQSKRFKEQFLANMSHEIRTPMNAVVGMTNLLLKTPLNAQQSKYLIAIKQSADNLLVIINDILDISKIEAGKMEFEATNFSVDDVVCGVMNTLMFKTEEKQLQLLPNIDEKLPPVLIGDPTRLNQILLNLTSNAVKFTDKGSVTVKCQLVDIKDEIAQLHFEVIDTGIGIPANKVASVFESFSQAESHTTRKYGGTGLGLTISKQLVEHQGGTIGLTSEFGKGTTFYFDISYPLGIEAAHGEEPRKESLQQLENLQILVVEDNDFNQMVAKDTLESLFPGSKIDIAVNGQIGVDMAGAKQYDIVLMDVNMPVMNGYDATRGIRNTLSKPNSLTPVMAMTASAIKEEVDLCYQAGMDDYIAKPFVPEELKDKIAHLVIKHRKAVDGNEKAQPISILIVDDNDFNQMVAADTLETLFAGAVIDSASNGKLGIEKIQNFHFDIVLMDIQMPVMDGFEATKYIRAELPHPLNQIPILAMTANVTQQDIAQCLAAGMDDHISKPFVPEELTEKILKLVSSKHVSNIKA